MADSFSIQVEMDTRDLERIARKMNVIPALKDGVEAAALFTATDMSEYPPASEANVSGPYPAMWYLRGQGSFWALKNGGFNGDWASENLSKRWSQRAVDDGMGAIVGNNASYARAVQDATRQTAAHKKHKWQTVQDFVREKSGHVLEIISDFIQAQLEGRR